MPPLCPGEAAKEPRSDAGAASAEFQRRILPRSTSRRAVPNPPACALPSRVRTAPERERPLALGGASSHHVSMTILVVDDDQAVRDTLRRALTMQGYSVEVAADGEEALRTLSN